MAPANRMPMSDMRKLTLAGLIVVGVFLLCCGAGMSSIAVGSIGVILAVGGPILIFATTLRGNVRSYVFGTARVVEVSPPPTIGPTGRGELGLVIHARGIDGVAVRVRDPAIPLNKWPQVGATLPVRSVSGSPRKTIVLWADVRTHDEATYDDRINPEYADLSDEERGGSSLREDEEFDHGPLPPDDTPTATDIPPVPARDGSGGGEPGTSERSASVAVAERRRPSPRPRKPVHDEMVAVAAAEPMVAADVELQDAIADPEAERQDAVLAQEEAQEEAHEEAQEATHEEAQEEAQEEAHEEAQETALEEAAAAQEEAVQEETAEEEQEEPAQDAEPEAAPEPETVEAAVGEAPTEVAEPEDLGEDSYEPGPEAFASLQALAPALPATRPIQASVIGPGDVEREIIAPSPYATDTYVPAPDPVPLNGPRHRAPDPIELPEPEPDTDPADVLEEEVPLGAVAEFLPATPQRRPVPLEGVNGVSVTLIVSDLQRSLRFYRETLGLNEVDSNGGSAVLASGDARVVLRRSADMPPVDRRVVHLNLEVPDVYEAYERLKAEGVEFVHRPRVVPQGEQLDLCTATFRDPDGHAISLTRWELRR